MKVIQTLGVKYDLSKVAMPGYRKPYKPVATGTAEEIVKGRKAEGVSIGIEQWKPPTATNPKGYGKFLVLSGRGTFPIKDALEAAGFKWNGYAMSAAIRFFKTKERNLEILELLGFSNVRELVNSPEAEDGVPLPSTEEPVAAPSEQTQEDKKQSQILQNMQSNLQQAMSLPASEKIKGIIKNLSEHIENLIEEIAQGVDKEAAGEFIKEYLSFSSKFRNFSFHNTILIMVQNPNATKVAGAVQWEKKFGRRVPFEKRRTKAIQIFGPPQKKEIFEKKEDSQNQENTPENEKKLSYSFVYYPVLEVYDYADTVPLTGAELDQWVKTNPDGRTKPYSKEDLMRDSIEDSDTLSEIFNAGLKFAESLGIDVQKEKMQGSVQGYSTVGKIRLNQDSGGLRLLTTLIHEIAHEILHTMEIRKDRTVNHKLLEIDAETTSQVVAKTFGFPSQDTERYLAIYRASGEEVRLRKEQIKKAASQIIQGLFAYIYERNPTKKKEETKEKVEEVKQTIEEPFETQ